MKFVTSTFVTLALASVALGHGALVAVQGENGVTGKGIGIVDSTPRDGTRRDPFQADTSIIRDREITAGTAGVCGRTLAGGNNANPELTQVRAMIDGGQMPTMFKDGTVKMTLHQINGDGGGPYTCQMSVDMGATFTDMEVVTNIPGENSRSRAKATDFPLVARATTLPDGPAMVRCRNAARAGPFGGCVMVAPPAAAAPAKRSLNASVEEDEY
ncbi:uncharacterized protein L969DRAFT_87852 [Mixia osmundae IAM 14324]|uniref:GEgh 16 protein n=1 Tax=Mixia osmundae (strain CBS 9802 / IAM 14324 / JCM 22182 / KY 12970) TaxID=764103 RepID=G7DYZ7_MIXOS|nr:uncharacterized protein L969DRAFT_87852 [Mixia osmundae IAM 14324]KEI38638.1 hypothetical protein L969DRAFT_87852 [Mixia osmundae IAM 14324]GAA95807.1 hypothetical protein E5Q_02464 [Mixia osmundae IAM 14324]